MMIRLIGSGNVYWSATGPTGGQPASVGASHQSSAFSP